MKVDFFNLNDYTKCYGVTFENNGSIKVQKIEDLSDGENIKYKINPIETFLGESEPCMMTAMSEAFDKSVFDGTTILLKIGEENDKHRYLYNGGDMICFFLPNDKIYKYISNMGNHLTPYSIAICWKNIYFLTSNFKFVEKEKVSYDDDVQLFNFVANCRTHLFKKSRLYKIPSIYD